jgi:hypothetical protein
MSLALSVSRSIASELALAASVARISTIGPIRCLPDPTSQPGETRPDPEHADHIVSTLTCSLAARAPYAQPPVRTRGEPSHDPLCKAGIFFVIYFWLSCIRKPPAM